MAKNLQKSVDKGGSVWYTKQAVSVRGSVEKALKKVFLKKLKKGIDKHKSLWYTE